MESLQYKLEQFEGPLDLLLTLVEKNKINIDDIPISLLCNQYMAYIAEAQAINMDLSAEFLIMASELMLIKSKMLLPRDEETEEDPRAALAAAMLEYQRIKQASVPLSRMFAQYGSRMVKDTDEVEVDTSYVSDQDVERLTRAMMRMLSEVRVTDEEALTRFEPLIRRPIVTVASVSHILINKLRAGHALTLRSYFSEADCRSTLIAMFMAMLELMKAGAVSLEEKEYSEDGIVHPDERTQIRLNPDANEEEIKKILNESDQAL